MGILDLPVELLRPIIHDVVLGCDNHDRSNSPTINKWHFRDVIDLARVNTVLEWEVFLILEKHRFLIANDSRPPSIFDLHPEYATFIAHYVLTRPYPSGTPWNTHFPALINSVVDTILRLKPHSTTTDSSTTRTHYISVLCQKASLHLLVSKRVGEITRRAFREHLIVAATYLRELSVLAELLCLETNLSDTHSDFWGSPVKAAVDIEDANLVQRFLLHGARFEHPGWLKDVVRASNAPQLLAAFIAQQKGEAVERTSVRDVADAVAYAIKMGKEDVAITLLDTQREAFGHGSLAYYLRRALVEACQRGMVDLVPKIIEAGAFIAGNRWVGTRLRQLLTTICETGHAAVLHILLEKTKSLSNAVPPSELILTCVKGDHIDTLRVLLNAGAKLDAISTMKLLAHVAPWPPASEAVLYLLQRRAVYLHELLRVEEHTGFGIAHLMMVAAQRGNLKLLEALARFGVPVDDLEFYEKAGCPVPVVAAAAFGQERTVRGLKEVVWVLELDRLKNL